MDKDRFDAFMKLAEFIRAAREGRRTTEWQLHFTVWAMIAGSAVALKGQPPCLLLMGGIIIIGLHGWWIAWNCHRANCDATNMYNLARQAELELGIEHPYFKERQQPPHRLEFLTFPPTILAWAITILLVIGALFILMHK